MTERMTDAELDALCERLHPRGQSFSADTLHLWAKSKFLGCDDHALPNGKTLTLPRSTANLDVAEFSDYFDRVQAWANEQGVFLEDLDNAA